MKTFIHSGGILKNGWLRAALWCGLVLGAGSTQAQVPVSFFTNGAGWTLNGSTENGGPVILTNRFALTDGITNQVRSGWYDTLVTVGSFEVNFTYENVGGTGDGDGVAFVLQNDGAETSALGSGGGGLGYEGINQSVALLINLFEPGGGRGIQIATAGSLPSTNYLSVAPVDLMGGNPIRVRLRYEAGLLQVRLRDTITLDEYNTSFFVDVAAEVGADTALLGFTGSTGAAVAEQTVSNFTLSPLATTWATFFTNGTDWVLNGSTSNGGPAIVTNRFALTDGVVDQVRSGWYAQTLPVDAFDATFLYENVDGTGEADGAAFVMQNDGAGTAALGSSGGGLGYEGISQSVALLLNIFDGGNGRGIQLATGGNLPSTNYLSVSPVSLESGNPILVRVRYTAGLMQVLLQDTVTFDEFSTTFAVDIPAELGTNLAYVGFTGATGSFVASQTVSDFAYGSLSLGATALMAWRDLQSLPFDGSQDTGNPSGDGVVNLMKFAFNLAPNAGDLNGSRVDILSPEGTEGLPRIERDEEGRLVVEFLRRKASSLPGVAYVVETGDNLVAPQPLSLSGAVVEGIDTAWERVRVTDPVVTPQRFGRVRLITLP